MKPHDFRKHGHHLVDWIADYLENASQYPVKSQVTPREIFDSLPESPPVDSETMDAILQDFKKLILPGITHWQSPNFFAYFPANSSFPSVLAEFLTAALGTQCMIWETSPSAAELEEKMMNWLKEMTGIPAHFDGVIQDTASTATLAAILSAREKCSSFQVNELGFDRNKFRIYCSTETHSSIEKAVKIAGIGRKNLVKIPVDEHFAMDVRELSSAIDRDVNEGYQPLCIIATLGTTGTTAIDPVYEIAQIATTHKIWLHVDAAFAGTALLLPEYRWMIEGIERVDSFVFNPHKWMFTNFDCSAYFVKDKETLIRTFEILPEYLKTSTRGQVNDYRDWGVPLGRRFRALKLWFVIRSFGVEGLQKKLREHISYARWIKEQVMDSPDFEMMAPLNFNLVCFRYKPKEINEEKEVNRMNKLLLKKINDSGEIYLTHTRLNGNYVLRMVIGQTQVTKKHVEDAWEIILKNSKDLNTEK